MKDTGPSAGTTNWDDIECERRSEPNYATGKNFSDHALYIAGKCTSHRKFIVEWRKDCDRRKDS